ALIFAEFMKSSRFIPVRKQLRSTSGHARPVPEACLPFSGHDNNGETERMTPSINVTTHQPSGVTASCNGFRHEMDYPTTMKNMSGVKHVLAILIACGYAASLSAQVAVPSTYKHISVDGSFSDWAGVPLAYTAPVGPTNAIQYENVYVANDEQNLYVRFTLYT